MKNIMAIMLALTWIVATASAQEKSKQSVALSVQTMPPSVVKTIPEAGDTAVDPKLAEIRVTFSKDMNTNRMWAVCQISKESFPENAGPIHYLDDNRTCVVPVKLQPGKTYVLWFNLGKFDSFRDRNNTPAVPYQLVFQTKGNGP